MERENVKTALSQAAQYLMTHKPCGVTKECLRGRGPKVSAEAPDGFCLKTVLFWGALYRMTHSLLGKRVMPHDEETGIVG